MLPSNCSGELVAYSERTLFASLTQLLPPALGVHSTRLHNP